jgi:hypothetical protein
MEVLAASRHHRLDVADMAWLHDASARLTAIAGHAFGDDTPAIELAARTARDARAGRRLDPGIMVSTLNVACGVSRGQ